MKKRLLSLLLCLLLVCSLLAVTAGASEYVDVSSMTVTHAVNQDGTLASVTAKFKLASSIYASATGRLVLMSKYLNTTTTANPTYGDFTDYGTYGSSFTAFEQVVNKDTADNTFGIKAYGSSNTGFSSSSFSELTLTLSESNTISLKNNGLYYIYLWTEYSSNVYPDCLICAIQVKDGALQFAPATGRNSYDAFKNATIGDGQTNYKVEIKMPGEYPQMEKTADSGDATQFNLITAMTPVTYYTVNGYCFPDDYSVATVNGIMVRRDDETHITVYGTPTDNTTITLAAPTVESMTFSYAYDVQRDPAFPKQGETVTLSNFHGPLNNSGSHMDNSYGNWTLTKVGLYSAMSSPSENLKGVVNGVGSAYNLTDAGKYNLDIHELKVDGTHIAYGVLIAYDSTTSRALFLGDNWNRQGAGYLLCNEKSNNFASSITMNAETVLSGKAASVAIVDGENSNTVTTATVGQTLFAYVRNAPAGANLHYQWYYYEKGSVTNTFFDGATNPTYKVQAADVGKMIGVLVFNGERGPGNYKPLCEAWLNTEVSGESVSPTDPTTTDPTTGELAWLTPILGALNSEPFDDVKVGDWFYDDVSFVNEYGLMTGTASRTFSPDAPVTRGMVMTILARREGIMTDRYSPWYAAGVEWAVANGISDGSNPEAEITREELATMLYRYAQLKGYDVSVGADTNILSFLDALEISDYAFEPLQWAVGSGLINGAAGLNAGKLLPQSTATRAQLAAMLHRFFG